MVCAGMAGYDFKDCAFTLAASTWEVLKKLKVDLKSNQKEIEKINLKDFFMGNNTPTKIQGLFDVAKEEEKVAHFPGGVVTRKVRMVFQLLGFHQRE